MKCVLTSFVFQQVSTQLLLPFLPIGELFLIFVKLLMAFIRYKHEVSVALVFQALPKNFMKCFDKFCFWLNRCPPKF